MEITSSLDQGIPLPDGSEEFLLEMRKKYEVMLVEKDLNGISDLLTNIYNMSKMSGILLANMLYWMDKDWEQWGLEYSFLEFAFDHLGYSRTTIDRYIAVGRMYNENVVPESVKEKLFSSTMRALVPIAKAVEQGYEIPEDRWERLASCPDDNSVRKELRSIKGVPPRKHSLIIMLEPDGELTALFGDDSVPLYIGYLNVDIDDKNVQSAISRIVDNANIIRRDHA